MNWVAFSAWLVLATVCLADGPTMVATMGDRIGLGTRQLYLALPLLFGPAALLLTPWAPWAAAAVAGAVALHVVGHGLWLWSLPLTPAPASLMAQVARHCAEWGVRLPDRVCIGKVGPAVIGLSRQVLVLPPGALGATEPDLEAMLAHEMAHVARRDPLRLWLAGIGRTLLFWHPVARLSLDALRLQVELQADAQAAAWLGDAQRYALSLARASLAFGGWRTPAWGAALAERPAELTVRLQTLLEPVPAVRTLRLPAWLNRLLAGPRSEHPPMPPRLAHAVILGTFFGYLGLFGLVLWLT